MEERYPGLYPRIITRGQGPYLYDDQGHRLLDAGAHLGAGQVGHGRTEIAERMASQAEQLEFVALDSGLSHPLAVELAVRLAETLPLEDPMLSFMSTGSEANEFAFKIARAYHARHDEPQRTRVLSRDGSYHGSTFAGVAATGARPFREGYGPLIPGFSQVPQPSPGRCGFCDRGAECSLACADALGEAIEREGAEHVAAVIAEPVAILQAVKVPHEAYWDRVQTICREAGALLIVDEVVTGFGRTGRMFGSEHWGIKPDIITMAKGLTSGYAPLGAVGVSRKVQEPFEGDPLLHLNTYAGHPVACAAALETLGILERERLPARAAALGNVLSARLTELSAKNELVYRTSAIGLLGSVELDVGRLDDPMDVLIALRHAMYERGLLARSALEGDVLTVVFYPTLVVDEDDLATGVANLYEALAEVLEGR